MNAENVGTVVGHVAGLDAGNVAVDTDHFYFMERPDPWKIMRVRIRLRDCGYDDWLKEADEQFRNELEDSGGWSR